MTRQPLRIAVVHSYYSSRQPSGENVVVDLQVDALRRAGHEVAVVARHTDEMEASRFYHLAAGARVATGRGGSPLAELRAISPDVVHVHNLVPNFGRAWTRRLGIPLVATVHNYRPICPAATLFRDGADCALCPDARSARPAVRHRCFKGSAVATLPLALGTRFADDPLLASADRIVTLNDDMRARYAAIGVPEERLVTVPNFVVAPTARGAHDGDFWLYVGRLTDEKGVLDLVRSWPEGRRLKVVGSGPLEDEVAAAAGGSVELLGQLPNGEVRNLLADATGLCFPSRWPEGLPTIYLEALAAGLPVLARPESVVGSLVEAEGTGLVATDSLVADLDRAAKVFPDLDDHCRAVFETRYTEAAWVESITDLYCSVRLG